MSKFRFYHLIERAKAAAAKVVKEKKPRATKKKTVAKLEKGSDDFKKAKETALASMSKAQTPRERKKVLRTAAAKLDLTNTQRRKVEPKSRKKKLSPEEEAAMFKDHNKKLPRLRLPDRPSIVGNEASIGSHDTNMMRVDFHPIHAFKSVKVIRAVVDIPRAVLPKLDKDSSMAVVRQIIKTMLIYKKSHNIDIFVLDTTDHIDPVHSQINDWLSDELVKSGWSKYEFAHYTALGEKRSALSLALNDMKGKEDEVIDAATGKAKNDAKRASLQHSIRRWQDAIRKKTRFEHVEIEEGNVVNFPSDKVKPSEKKDKPAKVAPLKKDAKYFMSILSTHPSKLYDKDE